jgi:hypothetical protein
VIFHGLKGRGGFSGFRPQVFFAPDDPAGDPPPPTDPPTDPKGDTGDADDDKFTRLRRSMGRQVSGERKRADAAEARAQELEAQIAADEEARLARAGEHEELAKKRQTERDEALAIAERLREENDAFKAREQARIERLTAANEERLNALPEHFQKLPRYPDPDQQAEAIAMYESQNAAATSRPGSPGVFGEPARPPSGGPAPSKEDRIAELRARAADVQLGRVKNNARGVTR